MKQGLLKIWILVFLFLPMFFASAHEPIRILLVPGHDDQVWGAQYGNIKEANMNLRLATELFNILKKDKRFEVSISRNSDGYTTNFINYFESYQSEIIAFREEAKKKRAESVANGSFVEKESVPHNSASENMSVVLYGINKWANENKIDVVVHIHFNDYPRENKWTSGKYKGFAIYVPEDQMDNSKESVALAKKIFTQLRKKYIASDYEKEKEGIVSDQSLIALGANSTLLSSVRSLLIEYGYIYRFGNSTMRHKAYTSMANLTATGLKSYFFPK